MKKERVCQGYKIIDAVRVGHKEIVLGHNLTAPQPYVTWESYEHGGFDNFYHGHYFDTHQSARIDFYNRVAQAWEYYEPAKNHGKKPKPPSQER